MVFFQDCHINIVFVQSLIRLHIISSETVPSRANSEILRSWSVYILARNEQHALVLTRHSESQAWQGADNVSLHSTVVFLHSKHALRKVCHTIIITEDIVQNRDWAPSTNLAFPCQRGTNTLGELRGQLVTCPRNFSIALSRKALQDAMLSRTIRSLRYPRVWIRMFSSGHFLLVFAIYGSHDRPTSLIEIVIIYVLAPMSDHYPY